MTTRNGGQDDHRPKISKKDLYQFLLSFYREHLEPLRNVRLEEMLCWLIQTGEAVPSVDFDLPSAGGVLEYRRANALTSCLTLEPSSLTADHIDQDQITMRNTPMPIPT